MVATRSWMLHDGATLYRIFPFFVFSSLLFCLFWLLLLAIISTQPLWLIASMLVSSEENWLREFKFNMHRHIQMLMIYTRNPICIKYFMALAWGGWEKYFKKIWKQSLKLQHSHFSWVFLSFIHGAVSLTIALIFTPFLILPKLNPMTKIVPKKELLQMFCNGTS